ncbi:MAG: NPCBM/NEW2 domain-containing protein [Phycisphaeraceae bacterium]|nr:NPCBM/NEW2 domain-containing protein [Phycisphaeraceae bacterium]
MPNGPYRDSNASVQLCGRQDRSLSIADLELDHVAQEVGRPARNLSFTGQPLNIAGRSFQRGLGVCAFSRIDIALDANAQQFTAWVGVDHTVSRQPQPPTPPGVPRWQANVEFVIVGDDRLLWRSGAMTVNDAARQVDVNLSGVHRLVLIVEPSEQGGRHNSAVWAEPDIIYRGQAPVMVTMPRATEVISSPVPDQQPRINGPRVIGARPGRPFLFTVLISGRRPFTSIASGLPPGLHLNAKTGRITGMLDESQRCEHEVMLTARNGQGTTVRSLKIVVGDQLALTPPMGWNSWSVWHDTVDQRKILDAARAMITSGLADHGWCYVNIDDGWQGARGGKYNAIQPNDKFPDIKGLCNQVHDMGLKIGIYSTPWVQSYAGYIGGSADNPNGDWNPLPTGTVQQRSIGRHVFTDNDVRQWAEWGFDYVKFDWNPNDVASTRQLAEAIERCGRDMILSLSNSTPFHLAPDLSRYANSWRTTGDIRDNWSSIYQIGFMQSRWAPYAGPGRWNDSDMLVVGRVGWGQPRPCYLTPDEQYTHVSLWCLLSGPLLLSCDMTQLDEFTLSLLTNDEVLELNQDPLGHQAVPVTRDERSEVWAKDLEDGAIAVGLFNVSYEPQTVSASWSDLNIVGKQMVRDLWRRKDLGAFEGHFTVKVPPHGVVLVRMRSEPACGIVR